jgi:hypothetical protein
LKRVVFSCALLLVLSLMTAVARADSYSGTWSVGPSSKAGQVHLRLQYRRVDANGNEEWDESGDVALSKLQGLNSSDLRSNGERKNFSVVEDAGTFRAEGTFSGGQGGGPWTFVPSSTFGDELRRRGIAAPSEKEQFQLAMGRFKLSTLDALLRSGFDRPSVSDLVTMCEHGVSDDYVNAMKGLRFSHKSVSELIRLRDHGVSLGYIAGLQRLGYRPSPEDLIRLVDHGVSVSFIESMRIHGYTHLSVDELIRLRDHGF